jgi:hypothetical protein
MEKREKESGIHIISKVYIYLAEPNYENIEENQKEEGEKKKKKTQLN